MENQSLVWYVNVSVAGMFWETRDKVWEQGEWEIVLHPQYNIYQLVKVVLDFWDFLGS